MRPFLPYNRLKSPFLRRISPLNVLRGHSRRTLVAPPAPGSGPLMSRRSDRALPPLPSRFPRWLRTLPLFLTILTASCLGIFNYQKSSSSVVSSTLYALRTSGKAREALGDEIYFARKIPWIWGELNQLHGRIDIAFRVSGTKGQGLMRFNSRREERLGFFKTYEWSLEMDDGRRIQLMEPEEGDPFLKTNVNDEA
ncbi:MAG: hypothetical protein M1837_004786 [Sclerophora amabilis]|nr:MAG: hypothetical protein M1837_004786 [Sclerophora amabilis]